MTDVNGALQAQERQMKMWKYKDPACSAVGRLARFEHLIANQCCGEEGRQKGNLNMHADLAPTGHQLLGKPQAAFISHPWKSLLISI